MRTIYVCLLLLIASIAFAQDYFQGKNLVCPSNNAEAMRNFNSGIKVLHLNTSLAPKYLAANSELFGRAIIADSTFCDAYFFAGYTLSLQKQYKEAFVFYYAADSMAQNKSLEFKVNLASTSLKVGLIDIARTKYNELIQYFPANAEGYYGYAVTSLMIGDVEDGLKNIDHAMGIYLENARKPGDDSYYVKAVLLTLNRRYEESLDLFREVYSTYKKDDNYNLHYALSLLKVSDIKKDEKMKKEALKYYNKIKDKNNIPKEIKDQLAF